VTIERVEGPSVIVRSGAQPEVTSNRILGSGPVIFAEGAAGLLVGNHIEGARSNGLEIASGATPTVSDNTIVQAKEAGVFIYGEGHIPPLALGWWPRPATATSTTTPAA
jgi:hypothetical protein